MKKPLSVPPPPSVMFRSEPTYADLVSAIERVARQYAAADQDMKPSLLFQYQALLEKEEQYFGLQSAPAEEEPQPKKRKKSSMSPENRAKAAERMRAMVAAKKAERAAA